MFKNKIRLGNNFHLKDHIPKYLTPGVVYNFQCGLCDESYYGECVRQLNVRTGEHIGNQIFGFQLHSVKQLTLVNSLCQCLEQNERKSSSFDSFFINGELKSLKCVKDQFWDLAVLIL